MKTLTAAVPGTLLVLVGLTAVGAARQGTAQRLGPDTPAPVVADISHRHAVDTTIDAESLTPVIMQYCVICHNDVALTGNLSLQAFVVEEAVQNAETAEKMIRKLAAGMMPPPGAMRPSPDTLVLLRTTLETLLDEAAAANPNPGHRSFQRLNRAEYRRSISNLLDLEVDAGDYLPLDTKSANFDNIADAQILSPMLMDAYFRAASEISRLAVGDPNATASEAAYRVSRWSSQRDRVEGAPMGTRGGVSVVHNFPADGEYVLRVSFHHETTGALFGNGRGALHTVDGAEQLEISVNGERVALLEVDRWMHTSDPTGVDMKTPPVFVRAGPQRITAAFLQRFEGPIQDLISPHDWSLASTSIAAAYGFTSLPHLRDLVINGPTNVTGVSETPSRRKIFTCRPTAAEEERPCAAEIVSRLGAQAYRRPLTDDNLEDLMGFYQAGAAEGGFELGIRTALEALLASPHFVFRFEPPPTGADGDYRISDFALASRLSFFLWASDPDAELSAVARDGKLSDPAVLEQQVRRMLADPRAEALGPRFAGQWLRLQDLEKIHPDVRNHPDFHDQLKEAMLFETELFFNSLIAEDRSAFDLYTADYTFVNERLARHYGIPDVTGEHFRRVQYPDDTRRGIFGHGSILTLTSHASRTSPVLRGKWLMEVILGTPPPPPPPGVPDLEETESSQDGTMLTTRQRMEMHRANPVCQSCHQFMDPMGLALDNFDATGKWRIKENGMPLDTRGQLYDGTPLGSPASLREALLARPDALVRNFTANLLAYGLGRRVEYYDMPTVRAIVRDAADNDYRMSSFILGVVNSAAFQMSRMPAAVEDDEQ